jgi:hypothetical protein
MSGENGGNEAGAQGGNSNEGGDNAQQNQGGDDKGFKPVTFSTQEELDAAFADRATRAANSAKAEALKVFQEAGASPEEALEAWTKVKAEEDAKKDPAVKEREAREKAERELQAYKNREARALLSKEVAKDLKVGDTPVPAELLAGSTKEEMEEHGKNLVAFIQQVTGQSGPRAPGYNPQQGYSNQDQVAAGDPIRNMLYTGQFQ